MPEDNCECTVDAVLDSYLATPSFSDKTRVDYASNLVPVREALGHRPADSITEADIEALRVTMAGLRKTSGPGKGGLKSARSNGLTVGRLRAALAAHDRSMTASSGPTAGTASRPSVVYVIAAEGSPLVKIGHAVDVAHRLQNLQSGSPVLLRLLGVFEGHDGRALERVLHTELAAERHHGEWFDLGPDPLAVVNALVA